MRMYLVTDYGDDPPSHTLHLTRDAAVATLREICPSEDDEVTSAMVRDSAVEMEVNDALVMFIDAITDWVGIEEGDSYDRLASVESLDIQEM